MTNCKDCNLGTTTLPLSGTDCGITDTNPLNSAGNCALDANGNPIVTATPADSSGCIMTANGLVCPEQVTCSPYDLTQLQDDSCIANSIVTESIQIGGAILNVYKLLGIHEQGLLQDLAGLGNAISNGDMPNFPAANAFDKTISEWRSQQTGTAVLASAYVGYDFGHFKLDNGRARYGIETAVKQDVATIKFKQGCHQSNRVTKIRIERSDDGTKWFGVALLNVPDCDGLITLNFRKTVPSRYWRIRPAAFNGGPNDYWAVQALQLMDYEVTAIGNIQDRIFLENRDRDYSATPIVTKCSYAPIDAVGNESKWGFMQADTDRYIISVSFTQSVALLGRPFVIGDIVQMPSETQYSPSLQPVLKYLEVIDVAWSTTGYTANWVPTLQRLIATPALASQETQNIFGKLTEDMDAMNSVDIDNGDNPLYQDYSTMDATARADANTAVPERGEDDADLTKLSKASKEFAAKHPNMQYPQYLSRKQGKYGVDALPPNGAPYTQGDTFPATPKNGDYHRLTFSSSGKDIPARLHRWSAAKAAWIYLETDRRHEFNPTKPFLQEFLDPQVSIALPPDQKFKP